MFGVMAYLTQSILPGIIIHAIGLLTFFSLIWPNDSARRLAFEGGADIWFWIHVAQGILFALLAVLSFRRLAQVTRHEQAQRRSGGAN
jgi:hypothetical protein